MILVLEYVLLNNLSFDIFACVTFGYCWHWLTVLQFTFHAGLFYSSERESTSMSKNILNFVQYCLESFISNFSKDLDSLLNLKMSAKRNPNWINTSHGFDIP